MPSIWTKEGERGFYVGKTKSGKTHLMIENMKRFVHKNQIQILETKGDEHLLSLHKDFGFEVPVVNTIMKVNDYKFPQFPIVVYAPQGIELADKNVLDSWCEWIYMRGGTVSFIDELTQIVTSTHAPAGFLDLYTRGRSRGCTVLAGNQRPRGIPPIVYTEAENIYKFRLNDERDRKRISEFTHPAMSTQTKDIHGFHYYNPERSNKVFYIKSI